MAQDRNFADVLQELYDARKSGSLFITVLQSSEDLVRIYLKNGEIYHLTYGSAIGQDALDIIEYYTLRNLTFLEGLEAPAGTVPAKFAIKKFIDTMRKADKRVRVA
jgi:hypothetical protein